MSREEAQKEALIMIDERISIEGEDSVAFMMPGRGKKSWTLKELRELVVNDTPLEGTKVNIIDDVLSMYKWKQEHKKGE